MHIRCYNLGTEWISFCPGTCRLSCIDCIPGKVHCMAAHISYLPASEIMVHIPQQTAGAWSCAEISRITGMHLNRTNPLFPVNFLRCWSCFRKITCFIMSTVAPCYCLLQFANSPTADQFRDAVKIFIGMSLSSMLGGQLVLVCEIHLPNLTCFCNTFTNRFFAIDMLSAVHSPDTYKCMVMIRRTNQDSIDILLIQALAPVCVLFGIWILLCGQCHVASMYITYGHHIFAL